MISEKERIKEIIKRLEKFSGRSKPPTKKENLLDVLIATKLSQNTTDKASFIAFQNLKKKFKNWDDVSLAPLSKIRNEIKVCGLADKKSEEIRTMLRKMKVNYGKPDIEHLRKFENEKVYEELSQYKGIGTKTISCVLAFGMKRFVFPVDTHVHRILNRLGIVKTKTPDETFEASKTLIPDENKVSFHTNLIKFGRSVCKAQKPICGECVLFELCKFNEKINYKKLSSKKIKRNDFIILENLN